MKFACKRFFKAKGIKLSGLLLVGFKTNNQIKYF
nr:MAG TPA: hypothetical protein [Caudoviricetes sp.]